MMPISIAIAKSQISPNTADGHHPVWSSDGKELFYTPGGGTRLVGVTVTASQGFAFGPARPIARPFTNRSGASERPFDAARDGQRFLGLMDTSAGPGTASRTEIHVVLIWFDELRARAPVKK